MIARLTAIAAGLLAGGCASTRAPAPAPAPAPALDQVTLAWTPVRSLTDHSPLTDLVGYRLTYGPSGSSAGQLTSLEPASVDRLTLMLAKGEWSFSVAAVSASHGTGLQSNTVTARVP